jgi:hypothetical protein
VNTLFGFKVVERDFMPKDTVLILGDWSSYVGQASEEEKDELRKMLDVHNGIVTPDVIKEYAKRCGLIVNIRPKE